MAGEHTACGSQELAKLQDLGVRSGHGLETEPSDMEDPRGGLLGTFMLLLDVTIVIVALPDIQTSLGASFSRGAVDDRRLLALARRAAAAERIAGGPLRPPSALRHRPRRLHRRLAALRARPAPTMLIASRAVQGVGGAIDVRDVAGAARPDLPRPRPWHSFGVWGAVTGVSVALGPVLGGLLTDRAQLALDLPRQPPGRDRRRSPSRCRHVAESSPQQARSARRAGFAVFTVGLLSLVYGLIRASEHGWTSGVVIGCFAVAARPARVLPVRRAGGAPADVRPRTCSASRRSSAALIAAFGMNGSLFAMFLYLDRLPPGRPAALGAADRPAAAGGDRRDPARGDPGRPALGARPRALAVNLIDGVLSGRSRETCSRHQRHPAADVRRRLLLHANARERVPAGPARRGLVVLALGMVAALVGHVGRRRSETAAARLRRGVPDARQRLGGRGRGPGGAPAPDAPGGPDRRAGRLDDDGGDAALDQRPQVGAGPPRVVCRAVAAGAAGRGPGARAGRRAPSSRSRCRWRCWCSWSG